MFGTADPILLKNLFKVCCTENITGRILPERFGLITLSVFPRIFYFKPYAITIFIHFPTSRCIHFHFFVFRKVWSFRPMKWLSMQSSEAFFAQHILLGSVVPLISQWKRTIKGLLELECSQFLGDLNFIISFTLNNHLFFYPHKFCTSALLEVQHAMRMEEYKCV